MQMSGNVVIRENRVFNLKLIMACNDAIFAISLATQDQAGTEMWSFEAILR
jgi:hypothetical protein